MNFFLIKAGMAAIQQPYPQSPQTNAWNGPEPFLEDAGASILTLFLKDLDKPGSISASVYFAVTVQSLLASSVPVPDGPPLFVDLTEIAQVGGSPVTAVIE